MSETFFGVSLSHIMRTEGVNKLFFDSLVFSGHPRRTPTWETPGNFVFLILLLHVLQEFIINLWVDYKICLVMFFIQFLTIITS